METTSYEISKQLAEAGFEANAGFYWTELNFLNGDLFLIHKTQLFSVPISIKKIAAYDLETVLNALPMGIDIEEKRFCLAMDQRVSFYYADNEGNTLLEVLKDDGLTIVSEFSNARDESLADCAARLLLKLVEKGLLTFKK